MLAMLLVTVAKNSGKASRSTLHDNGEAGGGKYTVGRKSWVALGKFDFNLKP